MAEFTRDEIEAAFKHFQATSAEAGRTGEWRPWADLFTADATYIEHHLGNFTGPDEIYAWISETMATPPNDEMTEFPSDWYVIDEDKGWVITAIWNRMNDPGDGSVHQAINWTLLKYAGDNKWGWEEDIYNPNEFGDMIRGWFRAKKAAAGAT